jgi:hypothetical protein
LSFANTAARTRRGELMLEQRAEDERARAAGQA